MTDYTEVITDLAVCAALRKKIDAWEKTLKSEAATLTRGTVYAYLNPDDPTSEEIGHIIVPKPSEPTPRVVDEDQAVAWAVEQFGESAMSLRLSDTGRKDVIAAAKRGTDVPGVETPEPVRRGPSFYAPKNVEELVQRMADEGRIDRSRLPQIGGGE